MIRNVIHAMAQFQRSKLTSSTVLNSTSNASTYATASFAPAVGDLLIVLVATTDASINPVYNAVTDSTSEITFTEITGALINSGLSDLYETLRLFVASNKATTTTSRNLNVTVTDVSHTPYTASGIFVTVTRVSGMTKLGSAAVRQYGGSTNQAGGGTPTVAFTNPILHTSAVIGWVINGSNPAGITKPIGWNELSASIGHVSPAAGLEYIGLNSGFTGNTITWGSTSATEFYTMGVELITT